MRCIAVCSAGFPGRSTRSAEAMAEHGAPLLICDLDGTILRGNSFPLWILWLMVGRLPELGLRVRVMLSLQVQKLLLQRRLGRIEHARLMREVQHAWHTASRAAAGPPSPPGLPIRTV